MSSDPHAAPALARWLGALRAGALPDNAQAYAALHAVAAHLDGLAATTSEAPAPSVAPEAPPRARPALNPRTREVLTELAAAARDAAKWLYGGRQAPREERLVDTRDAAERERDEAPRGNENEQWQRLIWLVRRASVSVDVDVDLPTVRDAAEAGTSAARTLRDEGAEALRAAWTILNVVGVQEARRLLVAGIAKARARVAARVEDVADRTQGAAEAVKPEQDAREVEEQNAVPELTEALKDTAQAGKEAVREVAGKGEHGVPLPEREEWAELLARSSERVIRAAREDPAVQDSLAKLVALGEAWSARLDALNERLQAGGPSLELGDSHVGASLEPSPAARGALQAARECLEGLAGGTSLGPTLRAWDALVTAARSESRLRQWAREAGETLRSCAGFEDGKPAMDIKQAQEALEKVLRELQEILQQTPAVKEHLQELVRCSSDFVESLTTEPSLTALHQHLARAGGAVVGALSLGVKGFVGEAGAVARDLVGRILPSLGEVFRAVPLPRVEFTSDAVDAAVEDIVIPTLNLVPETVSVSVSNDYSYSRDRFTQESESSLDARIKLGLGGLRLGVKDVSFWVEEKVTAPRAGTCGGCCGCFASEEDWDARSCVCQGPASWLAYRESALLDIGLWDEGLKVDIDLVDAGQQAQRDTSASHPPTDDMDETRRESFFTVKNVAVDAGAFDFRLRNSHHWLVNALFRPVARPIVRLVLQRVGAALVQSAVEQADRTAWDLHSRATRLAQQRHGWGGKEVESREEVKAAWGDYVRVLLDADAGKSGARLRKEREAREREEKEQQRQQREEQQDQREQRERMEREQAHPRTEPLKPTQTMKVSPTSLIMTDTAGSYALSVGVAPRLLAPHKRGPKTDHMRLRDDLVERNWRALGKRPVERARAAYDEVDPLAGVRKTAATATQTAADVRDVRDGVQLVQEHGAGGDGEDEYGFKSDLFDLH